MFSFLFFWFVASASADLGFDWLQSGIHALGLGENNGTEGGCVEACKWIDQNLRIPDILPSDTAYFKEKSFFWSQQQSRVSPQCFVLPTNAADVAAVVKLAERTQCPFAVKSGGHAAFAGASNIADGMTIDLQLLNEITLEEDRLTTRVGPGNRWIDVYEYLSPKGVSVVGGRVAEIGVGGLVLGGGISFFSGRHGWALDGVRNYELVVAGGEVLQVNQETFPDLYWALRGGGNNFGVVTRLDLETFEQGDLWAGTLTSAIDTADDYMDALHNFAHNAPTDPDAAIFVAFAWAGPYQMYAVSTSLTHARAEENPPIFENFTKIPTLYPPTLAVRDLPSMTVELNASNPNGFRESYHTGTFVMTREMLQTCFDIFQEEIAPIKKVEGLIAALVQQPITADVIGKFSKNGGNCLGIEEGEAPLLLINIATMWSDPADDAAVLRAARRVVERATEKAREMGLANRYLYQNYADVGQRVMESYGEGNLERLREVSRKYDPEGVFQKLQPGYFKL